MESSYVAEERKEPVVLVLLDLPEEERIKYCDASQLDANGKYKYPKKTVEMIKQEQQQEKQDLQNKFNQIDTQQDKINKLEDIIKQQNALLAQIVDKLNV